MTSTFRIPKARIAGPYGAILTRFVKGMWGQVPDNAYALWHNRRVMKSVLRMELGAMRWKALDPQLSSYAEMAAAGVIGCSWCLDFGYFQAHRSGLDLDKVRDVPRWRESDRFTATERDVMEYAEAMTATPPTVTDALSARLLEQLGAAAMVELTQLIALENMRSRFNAAAGLESQGFSSVCELPLAVPSPA
ncbi:carboxymuconolactone decarboxylase family protein [Microbacterium amylolyticum]|uniref:Alkylhydroperoxidase family enzyme n=1 Tax=Microbacterium amylolyticum TaxID=936337 RepID=A0ABS4ZJT3_9MICO|nr:carboxymuconolactone decarboxylase family protein [Microbacterium amylolyticum]MBP2436726.1 alkylhydroperoxidase family enzyme [Microbacterium amylolyticum]